MRIIFIWLLFLTLSSRAQELPPVTNFDPVNYEAGNQNWMISQGTNAHIYFANSSGLLEFTGTKWNLYPVPNKTIVRAVEVVGDKIFTGAYMEVGYWQKNELGLLEYSSLLPKFPRKIQDGEQFWRILHVDEMVFFQSFEGIYLYNLKNEQISVLPTPRGVPISNIFRTGKSVYFLIPGKGLYTINEGESGLIIPNEKLKNAEVMFVWEEDENLHLVTRTGSFLSWDGNELVKEQQELSTKLNNASIFSALRLQDNSFLLGSVEDGLFHVTEKAEIIEHYNQENGLQNNTILSLFLDEEQNVWAGLDNGLSVLNLDSSFRLFKDSVGRIGTVYTSHQTDDLLYLGTNQGLYYRKEGENRFRFIEGTNGQVWSLEEVDNVLFMGHNNGTYVVEDGEAKRVSERLGTWTVQDLKSEDGYFVQGHYNGISLLRKEGDAIVELPMLEDFPHSSKNIVSEADGDIWIGNEHKGVFKIKLNPALDAVSELVNFPFRDEVGVSSGIFRFNDTLYFSTRNKIFKYEENKNEFNEDNRLADLFKDVERSTGKIVEEGNRIWAFTADAVLNIEKSQYSNDYSLNKIFVPREMRSIPAGYENVSELDSEKYLLGLVDGYLLFDEDGPDHLEDYEVSIDQIFQSALDEEEIPVSLAADGEFEYRNNNISFTFSIPEYKKFLIPQYSYRLAGLSDRWSEWSSKSNVSYENLPSGSYTFEVRGKVGDNILPSKFFHFEVLRPWYYSNLAIAGYVLLFLILLVVVHHTYKRVHQKRLLEHAKDLRMKNMEAEQQIIRLQKEQLEKEMEGKNKELAVSTMSLVKKNEFLTSLKQKLKETEDSSKMKSVIKTIDEDINEEDNWNFFEKAFSNADKDFFRKIKEKHPGLTSNDLKLCAYLRLNLSSKEIAPLLNISVKSVEIKRYRLRKKMDLSRDVSLVNYILEI